MAAGKPVVRVGDLSQGEKGFPPRPALQGDPRVFVNGKQVVFVGSLWAQHCIGSSCHTAISVSGSSSVFVSGVPLVRVGDKLSDTDIAAQGSPNVFAGTFGEPPTGPKTWGEMTDKTWASQSDTTWKDLS